MKKFLILALFLVGTLTAAQAQKIGYVDTEYILEQMEEYSAAQAEVEQISKKWQEELEKMYEGIEQMDRDYQAEEVLLAEDVKKQRQEAIFQAERKAKEYKQEKFGYDGELYTVQDQKIKPLQDKVYQAIEEVAKERKLDIMFDKSGNSGMLYTNAIFDRTDEVMKKLGLAR
mgnify:CR=1 FL=1